MRAKWVLRTVVACALATSLQACRDKKGGGSDDAPEQAPPPSQPGPGTQTGTGVARFALGELTATAVRGYGREVRLQITGGAADTVVFVKPDAAAALEDEVVLGFVGGGSVDAPVLLKAGVTRDVILSINAPDAPKDAYTATLGVYSLASEDADTDSGTRIGSATLKLTLTDPVASVSLERVSQNEATLTQTWRLTNTGDELEGISVVALGLFGTQVSFVPKMEELNLAKGESVTFELVPTVYPGMREMSGEIGVVFSSNVASEPGALLLADGGSSDGFRLLDKVTDFITKQAVGFASKQTQRAIYGWGQKPPSSDQEDKGSHCTNEGKVPKRPGKNGRKPPKNADGDIDDRWTKKGMASLYSSNMNRGIAVGKGLNKVAKVPIGGHFSVLESLTGAIANRIGTDPPDANFTEIAYPTIRTAPQVSAEPDKGFTAAMAAKVNDVLVNGHLIIDLSRALLLTFDKIGGAKAANDKQWIRRQGIVYRSYAAIIVGRLQVQSQLLAAMWEALPDEDFPASISADVAQQVKDELAATGFSADEIATFTAIGMTAPEIEGIKNEIVAADAADLAQYSLRDFGTRLFNDAEALDLAAAFEILATEVEADMATVTEASMSVKFRLEAGRCPIGPHSMKFYINEQPFAALRNLVPEGNFLFPIDPAKIKMFGGLPGSNTIEVEALDMNAGDYVRAVDVTLHTRLAEYGALVFADDQPTADQRFAELPGINVTRPDAALFVDRDSDALAFTSSGSYLRALKAPQFALDATQSLGVRVVNMGTEPTGALRIRVYAADPTLGDPGAELVPPVAVADSLAPGATAKATVSFAASILQRGETPATVYLWVEDQSGLDNAPGNNVMSFSNERPCD